MRWSADGLADAGGPEGTPRGGLGRGYHGPAQAPFQLLSGLHGPPRRARAEKQVGFGQARPLAELDHDLGVLIVDALGTRPGCVGLGLDVQHLKADGLQVLL
jgi:hypothetical protein